MRLISLGLALCAAAAAASPEYHARREALAKAEPNGIIVLFGAGEAEGDELRSRFYQEPNFYYLTGWKQPGAILLIDPKREVLFLPTHNLDREKWTGPEAGPDDPKVRDLTGCDTVLPAARFESELRVSLEQRQKIYTVGDEAKARLRALAPLRPLGDAEATLARMRMRKSPREIDLLQRAADATVAAHLAAWKKAAPGMFEYQVAATLVSVYMDLGCERSAYPPIVGSGPDSVYLHYQRNERRMDRGDLLLMDAGGECAGYTADVTRTIPVGGKFTKRQREIYEIVLGAQKAAINAVKPGVAIGTRAAGSLYQIAYDYIDSHGKDVHGDSLGKYFTHGISHQIGLEVHDAAEPGAALAEGMVISVEPGIYIPEENIGIRIEDMVLVTQDGARVLTAALPREAADIEKALLR
ncbi:MAG: Xaa-Pro peptidase family protein [Acidobacteriia bacterium]|nr:Xaa-Pro peptidase family protein [Terriglobia bacterium]